MPLHAAALDAELWDAARRAFTRANARRLAVRTVALTLESLEAAESQLDLWEVEAANSLRASEASEGGLSELGAHWAGPGGPGQSTVCVYGGQALLVRPVEQSTPTHAWDGRGPALQVAIDRIRGRWGARGVVRGAGLALSGGSRTPGPRNRSSGRPTRPALR